MLKIKIPLVLLVSFAASMQMQAQKGWEWAFKIPDSAVAFKKTAQNGQVQVPTQGLAPATYRLKITNAQAETIHRAFIIE
jgi:hypothetical protein